MPAGASDKRPAGARRFKRREIELAEGGKLVLGVDGSIMQTDATGETVGSWKTGDDGWERHAIRFGVLPQTPTAPPPQSRVNETRRL